MMRVQLKKLAVPHQMTFTADAEVVDKLVEECFNRNKQSYEVKGFRKGNAPRNVVEKALGRMNMYREIFDELYTQAVQQQNLNVVEVTEFSVVGIFEEKQPLTLEAKLYLYPTAKFDMTGLKIEKKKTEVTDEDVTDQLRALQSASAKYINIIDENYEIKDGDAITLDFIGRCDGKEFEGGTSKNYRYVVGETKFVEGFEEQILKLKIGVTTKIIVKFPADYSMEKLRNKDVEFEVTLKKIEQKVTKSVEELATDEKKDVETFKQDIKTKLIEDKTVTDEENFRARVLSICTEKAEIDPIPDIMIVTEIDQEWNQLLYRIDKTEEEYLKMRPNGKEIYYGQHRPMTEKLLKTRILLDHICNEKNITATDDEIDNYIMEQSKRLNKSEADIKNIKESVKKPHNKHVIERTVKHDKATKMIIEIVTTP